MHRKFLLASVMILAVAVLCPGLLAQGRVVMSSPVIRSAGNDIVVSARLVDFVAGKSYRLGVGIAGTQTPAAKVELLAGDTPYAAEPAEFEQGYTKQWWGVEKIKAKGYALAGKSVPATGTELTVRVTIPRDSADQYGKFYVFVARDYGSNTYYLEDGVELDKSYW